MNQSTTALNTGTTTTEATSDLASGKSIFWALTSLAINAMLQPSFTGYVWSGNRFQGSMWPHRSSPFICIVDGVAELVASKNAPANDRHVGHHHVPPASHGARALRLVVFFVGVLPQAVKLFSMRGIPLTQFFAAALLVSSIPGMLRSLRGEESDRHVASYVTWLSTRPQSDSSRTAPPMHRVFAVPLIFGIVSHTITVLVLCHRNRGDVQMPLPDDISNALDWLGAAVGLMWTVILPLASSVGLFRAVEPALVVSPIGYLSVVLFSNVLRKREKSRRLDCLFDTFSNFANLGLLSLSLAWVLCVSATCFRTRKKIEPDSDPTENLRPAAEEDAHPVGTQSISDAVEINTASTVPPYVDQGTQTLDHCLALVAESMEDSSIDLSDVPTNVSIAPVTEPNKAQDEEIVFEPWVLLGLYWTMQLLDIDSKRDSRQPPTKNKATQTESDCSTGLNESIGCAGGEESHFCRYCVPVAVMMTLARFIGPLYLAVVLFRGRRKEADSEAAVARIGHATRIAQVNRRWKTAVLYPPLFILNLVLAFFNQYPIAFQSLRAMLQSYNGDVMWIAFGIANFITAAVYYLVLFDGHGTSSPSWLVILG